MDRQGLLQFLDRRLGVDPAEIADDTPLFTSGILDSFSMVDLILFVEQSTGTRMSAGEVRMDNLDSVARVLAYARSVNGNGNGNGRT